MAADKDLRGNFANDLLQWDRDWNRRQMPWKGEKEPYRVWVSEIILQQTRVDQGMPYYERFIQHFPNIQALAGAPEELVFKQWEGLGYYSRCRNLIHTARRICDDYGGKFPSTYESLLELKGVGDYTAAAIASFAFGLPYAVVDGNVMRVLSRVFGIDLPVDSTEGRKYFNRLAGELLDKADPAKYNQAIMDFGSSVCRPVNPACEQCVCNRYCKAFIDKRVEQFPLKEKKAGKRSRWFYYLVLEHKGELLIRKRMEKDIWKDLHEFLLIETDGDSSHHDVLQMAIRGHRMGFSEFKVNSVSPIISQQLTHQKIKSRFIRMECSEKPVVPGMLWIEKRDLIKLAFPRLINSYLRDHYL